MQSEEDQALKEQLEMLVERLKVQYNPLTSYKLRWRNFIGTQDGAVSICSRDATDTYQNLDFINDLGT